MQFNIEEYEIINQSELLDLPDLKPTTKKKKKKRENKPY